MKQWITDYGSYGTSDGWTYNKYIGLLNIGTNNTIELVTLSNSSGIFKKDKACYYKVLSLYV